MPLPSSRKGVIGLTDGVCKVKLNFKGVSFLKLCLWMQPLDRKLEFPWNFAKKKIEQKKSIFGKTGDPRANKIKETPLKIQLYLTNNIALPKDTFSRAWQWHWFDLGLIYTFLLADWWFAARFSNCSSSLNFEAKSNFYTIKENCWKCRAKCTGLKLDLGPFSGSQKRLLFNRISWWPCSYRIK